MTALQLQSLSGLVLFPLLAFLLRERARPLDARRAARIVGAGIALQLAVAGLLLAIPAARAVLMAAADAVEALQRATAAGTSLVFGYLGGGAPPFEVVAPENTFILFFQGLPLVLLVSALTALLYHWGILQRVVAAFAWALGRTLGVPGPLATAAAGNVFVGMVEALLLVRPYVATLDRGTLFGLMSVGLATIAGTVLVLYATVLGAVVPDAAGHLVVASVISAPAAIVIAYLMVPPDHAAEPPVRSVPFAKDADAPSGPIDAIMTGTRAGLDLLLAVAATLVVFVALVALSNQILGLASGPLGIDLTLERLAGFLFVPVAWAMGIPASETVAAGGFLGVKTVTNELVAFLMMAGEAGEPLSERSRLILTYAMAGFANFGSLGILIGGLAAIAPGRRREVVALGMRALLAGTLATMMTGSVIGAFTP